MRLPLKRIILVFVILLAAGLACNFPGRNTSSPPPQQPSSTQAVQELEQQLKATLSTSGDSGQVTITLTQEQLTSIVAAQLAKQPDQSFTDPQVVLTNGQMEVYGKVSQSGFTTDTKIVMTPEVDGNGKVHLNIVSISLGPFPVPDTLKQQFSDLANKALNDYLDSTSQKVKVTSINITEGKMTITGERLQ